MRPLTSASPNKVPISNFASVDRDKTRGQTYISQYTKVEDVQSPKSQNNNLNVSQQNEIQTLKKLVIQLDSRINQQNETITQIKTDLEKMKELNSELQEKLKMAASPTFPNSNNLDRRAVDDQKKIKQEIMQLGNKFSEMKVDYETKQMSLEEKVRSIQISFENRMKIFFESKMEFEDIYNSINQLANELSLLKEKTSPADTINETYHVDQKGYLMDSQNNYLLDKGQMIKLNEKQISYLKQHHKLL
ncbi:unnamed protein product (macronuclear) [Paramecium tetraurelia]|uniref:Uncharacterized protein n=1 Tax=Paramecium tetraurelia TaxID=5888 RepID=A0DTH1_PARTE|nr:uncharacterized protein GSPATT00020019001 [Paramecium tetraurelia]CAK86338.1 unnamed protein product [Paramecium tetraurelia]|eukprot:XP_001453735.1 hypothetical protein (macronuclear) [Paramecium tetraurelia strain d4-2]